MSRQSGLISRLLRYLWANALWWLIPMLLILGLLLALVWLIPERRDKMPDIYEFDSRGDPSIVTSKQ